MMTLDNKLIEEIYEYINGLESKDAEYDTGTLLRLTLFSILISQKLSNEVEDLKRIILEIYNK